MTDKKIELWEGYEVTVNARLMDDMDFVSDLNKASRDNDYDTIVDMYMALIGGEKVANKIREHIEKKVGYFSQEEFLPIVEKINEVLPKGGNRAERRSWKTSV